MASSKQKLQGLIGSQPPIQKGAPYSVSGDAASAPAPTETAVIQRGASFIVSTSDDAEGPLPEAVLALRDELREIARSYIGARRRSGRALLEAARWLSEARAAAEHGEWDDFLEATATTADTAERLLRIYERSMQHPAFAAAVADGRLNQSAAERLARGSTPVEVIDEVLTAEQAPSVAQVDRAIRAARRSAEPVREDQPGGQIPQIAEFGDQPSSASPVLELLREVAVTLGELAASADAVPPGEESSQLVRSIEQSLSAIRSSIRKRGRGTDG
jgi:hypothetical protein